MLFVSVIFGLTHPRLLQPRSRGPEDLERKVQEVTTELQQKLDASQEQVLSRADHISRSVRDLF